MPASYPPWNEPPQCSYGWFVDVPPPRGPYLWPCIPENYKLRPPIRKSEKSDAETKSPSPSSTSATASSSTAVTNEPLFEYEPQLVWGWFCAVPPPQPPYLWPCIPEGYVLVRQDEVSSVATVASPIPHTTAPLAATQPLSSRTPSNSQTETDRNNGGGGGHSTVATVPTSTTQPSTTPLPFNPPPFIPPATLPTASSTKSKDESSLEMASTLSQLLAPGHMHPPSTATAASAAQPTSDTTPSVAPSSPSLKPSTTAAATTIAASPRTRKRKGGQLQAETESGSNAEGEHGNDAATAEKGQPQAQSSTPGRTTRTGRAAKSTRRT